MIISDSYFQILDSMLGKSHHHSYLLLSRSFLSDTTPTDFVAVLIKKLAHISLFNDSQKPDEKEFWEAFDRHPDLIRADPERSILRKEDIENFRERTLYPPTFASRRFLLIERAERMNNQSANSLLKTLEEPQAASVFVLTSARPHVLPTTITSRCQKISLPPWNAALLLTATERLEPEDARFLDSFFNAPHLVHPPTLIPTENLSTSQKINLSPQRLSEIAQWCDSAGRKYTALLLRDALVEKTSNALTNGRMSQARTSLFMFDVKRWSDADPFHPTNSFWLMRILLTLAH